MKTVVRSGGVRAAFLVVFAAGLILGAAAAVGVATVASPQTAVVTEHDVSGVVTLVNQQGTSLCIDEGAGKSQQCADILATPGSPGPSVGDHITGTLVSFPVSGGRTERLILTPQAGS